MLTLYVTIWLASDKLAHPGRTDNFAVFGVKIETLAGGADMSKSREKIQQLGFWDAEVSKPDHDAVCNWAYENADSIFRTVAPERFDRAWSTDEIRRGYFNKSIIEMASAFASANPRPNPRIFRKTLEYVLKSYTGYQDKMERIVGYADLLIETECPRVDPKYRRATNIGWDDELDGVELVWSRELDAPRILVEAKSTLPTLGELMRQIQLYRTAFGGKVVVVSPDDAYAKILGEQGVIFVKCTI